jgi:hypothetical protein
MSVTTKSISERVYQETVYSPLSFRVFNNVESNDGYFSRQIYDTKLVTILKNVAYKATMFSLPLLSSIELVARSCLSLVAYAVSLIATPIEWTLKVPVSVGYYKELPTTSISNKIYQFGFDLCNYNYGVSCVAWRSFYRVLFERNHVTQGLLD